MTKTVLLVDDDAAIRTVVGQALGRAGYNVHSASTVAGAWRWIDQGEGDLVITDVVLPDESGFDLLQRIKSRRSFRPLAHHCLRCLRTP